MYTIPPPPSSSNPHPFFPFSSQPICKRNDKIYYKATITAPTSAIIHPLTVIPITPAFPLELGAVVDAVVVPVLLFIPVVLAPDALPLPLVLLPVLGPVVLAPLVELTLVELLLCELVDELVEEKLVEELVDEPDIVAEETVLGESIANWPE